MSPFRVEHFIASVEALPSSFSVPEWKSDENGWWPLSNHLFLLSKGRYDVSRQLAAGVDIQKAIWVQ